jgi:CheY-like chemotaxis protein
VKAGDVASILIVDDDAELRLLLRVTLSDLGHEIVAEAADGRQGVAYAAQLQPDAIILDLAMPALDGLAALPMFAEVAPTTPVIVLTADTDDQTAARVRALGAFSLLTKPTTMARLAELLDDATSADVSPLAPSA